MKGKHMGNSSSADGDTAGRDIVIRRLIDAPRERVFDMWTRPEHAAHWWGPTGFTITTKCMEVRPGGTWRFTLHAPNGMEFPNRTTYLEVVKPGRLAYWYDSGSDDAASRFHVTVTFDKQGERTYLTMRSVFATAAERDKVIKEHNAIEGGNQTLDRLEAYLWIQQGALQ
jgi:uncharacterized protein YndB with AHSA1/START domain